MKTSITKLQRNLDNFKLWSILDAAYRSVFKARQLELMEDGILIMQLRVLAMILAAGDEATPANLARMLRRRPHTISQIINRMAKAGLVTKVPNPQFRNRVCVRMTPKGEEIYDRSRERHSFNRIMAQLGPEKRQQLAGLLEEVWTYAQKELPEEDQLPHPWEFLRLVSTEIPPADDSEASESE